MTIQKANNIFIAYNTPPIMHENTVEIIASAIVAIASLIFVKKRKIKRTPRKTKSVNTTSNEVDFFNNKINKQ